jgi:tetratricopeptide (TPR) repeat protein
VVLVTALPKKEFSMFRSFSFIAGGLAIGLTIGFLWANYTTRTSVAGQAAIAGGGSTAPGAAASAQTPTGNPELMPDILEVIKAADANKSDFDLQIRAGALYAQISRPEKAIEFFNKAVALNPSDPEKIRTLGDAFFDIGDFTKSREFYLRVLKDKPNDVSILTPLGVTYLAADPSDTEKGIEYLQRVLKIDEKYQPALVNLGLAYIKLGDKEKAREIRDRLNAVAPNSDFVSRLDESLSNAPFSRR